MKVRIAIAAGILLLCALMLYATGFVGSSCARVARDHSVVLPPSTSNIQCEGLFCITAFGDFEADASFEVASEDLPRVLSQFAWKRDVSGASMKSFRPGMPVPTRFTHPSPMHIGVSRDANEVYLQSYDVSPGRDGVYICTSWN